MVYKVFATLVLVNLFTMVANVEAAEYRDLMQASQWQADYMAAAGDDEILIEKGLSKSKCLMRVASLLGSRWFNDKIELQRVQRDRSAGGRARYSSTQVTGFSAARYGLNLGSDEFSLSMKMKF